MDKRLAKLAFAALLTFASSQAAPTGRLENPQNGGTETGVSAITGWHCTAQQIELRIDGNSIGMAGRGTPRADTASVCGRSDTGFSLLYNYALLRGGTHRIDAYADGQLFGSATFQASYLGAEFLTGLSSSHQVPDFPAKGQKARVAWSEGKQDFMITGVESLTSGAIAGSYSVRYVSMVSQTSSTGVSIASSLQPGLTVVGTMTFNTDGTYWMQVTLTLNGSPQSFSGPGTYTDNGFYLLVDGAGAAIVERGDTLTFNSLGRDAQTSNFYCMTYSMARVAQKGETHSAPHQNFPPGGALQELLRVLASVQVGT